MHSHFFRSCAKQPLQRLAWSYLPGADILFLPLTLRWATACSCNPYG